MTKLEEWAAPAQSIAILGHVNPDGDCIGSCLAAYHFIRKQYPDKDVAVYQEQGPEKFSYLKHFAQIRHTFPEDLRAELCICLDVSAPDMLGGFAAVFEKAEKTVCVDHHVTNAGFAQENIIYPQASSASEVLYTLLPPEAVDKEIAECLYTGIVTDSGVFKYDNTSPLTMEIAGKLMACGIDFGRIIDDAFYKKTYLQTQVMGRALMESVSFLDGKCIFSVVTRKDMDFYGVKKSDLQGIVEQLRLIDGVEVSVFLNETAVNEYKVSMRSKNYVDISQVAKYFGGGGHKKAAGCTMTGTVYDVINNLSARIEPQIRRHGQEDADV